MLGAILVVGAGTVARTQLPASTVIGGNAARGRMMFERAGCSQCHGTAGQGASTGARLAPGLKPYRAFALLVRNPINQMPAYSPRLLDDAKLLDIWAYLSHVSASKTSDQIPMLRAFGP